MYVFPIISIYHVRKELIYMNHVFGQAFLNNLVASNELECSGGMYSMVKATDDDDDD